MMRSFLNKPQRSKGMDKNLISELEESIQARRTFRKDKILLISENALAKRNNKESAKHEYEMGKYLFEQGVQVPEMYDLRFVLGDWYIIMQKIEGVSFPLIPKNLRDKAINQYRAELEKILELEIYPEDAAGLNVLFHTPEEKVYLIDFELWHKGSANELNQLYQWIKSPELNFSTISPY